MTRQCQSSNLIDWETVLIASMVTMLLLLVLFALVQRYIDAGSSSNGMKSAV
jgi:ABC-type glycerol-3-phosphate transport system permease component